METKERYIKHTLDPSMKPRYRYRYYVIGRGAFPLDMLRYDCAWPVSADDAANIGYTGGPLTDESNTKLRSIEMASYREPTIARWGSFGWSVWSEKLGE